MKTIHPAIAEHVMEENERLRGLLREARDYLEPTHDAFMRAEKHEESSYVAGANLHDAIDAALSRQAEPGDEPAPAQDELRKRFDEIEFEVAQGKHTAASVFTQMRTAAMYIRPAQTEQQPIRLPERKRTDHLPKEYKTMTVVRAGLEAYNRALDDVAALNAAHIRQTEQQPSTTQQVLGLILEECRYWQGRDEARRGGFACLYAKAKEIADNAAPVAQTAPQPEQSGLVEAAKAFADAARKNIYPCPDKPNSLSGKLQNLDRAIAATLSTQGTKP